MRLADGRVSYFILTMRLEGYNAETLSARLDGTGFLKNKTLTTLMSLLH